MRNLLFSKVCINEGSLDVGIYNNLLYYITEKGDLKTLYLNIRKLAKSERGIIATCIPDRDPVTIATFDSFPLDSIIYKNRIFVATLEGLEVLSLRNHYECEAVSVYKEVKPVALRRGKNFLALSLSENGIQFYSLDENSQKRIIVETPSTDLIMGRKKILSLYPDTTPEILSIDEIITPQFITQEDQNREIQIIDNQIDLFKKNECTGRDIVLTYSDSRIIIAKDRRGQLYPVDYPVKFNDRKRTWMRNETFFNKYLLSDCNLGFVENKHKDSTKKNKVNLPLDLYFHPYGVIEEYSDHVDFVDLYGDRTILAEDEDIAQVRTFTNSSAYSNIITIATENRIIVVSVAKL